MTMIIKTLIYSLKPIHFKGIVFIIIFSCSAIIGVDDKEDRYNTIINLYTKVIKK